MVAGLRLTPTHEVHGCSLPATLVQPQPPRLPYTDMPDLGIIPTTLMRTRMVFTHGPQVRGLTIYYSRGGRQAVVCREVDEQGMKLSDSMDPVDMEMAQRILRWFKARVSMPAGKIEHIECGDGTMVSVLSS